jgi:hypothetical protein
MARECPERAAHGGAEGDDGGARRRRSYGCNWEATGGQRARASIREACTKMDWGGGGVVMAAHGNAVRGWSKRRRRRWNVGRALEIGY